MPLWDSIGRLRPMDMNKQSNLLLNLAAVVVILAGLKWSAPVIMPLLVSVFIAMIAAPPVFWLESRRVPAVVAVLSVVGVIVSFAGLVGMVLAESVDDFLLALPGYQAQLGQKLASLQPLAQTFDVPLNLQALQDIVDPGAAVGLVSNLFRSLGGLLANSFVILLLVIFILLEASSLPVKMRAALQAPEATLERFGELASKMNTYVAIKTWVSLGTGMSAAVLCWSVGVDFPLVLGLLAFLLNYIPNIGSILAAIPAVMLALIGVGEPQALLVALGYFAINTVFGNVIEPRFQGRGVGLSTFVVFFSLVFWGWLLGSVGMLLSIPLTMSLKIALAAHDETRWLSVLLGPQTQAEEQD